MKQIDGIRSHYSERTYREKYGGVVRVVWILFTGSMFFFSVGMFVGVNMY